APSSFFFSSRRRHTRSKRDWSSDVCSSDLILHTQTNRVDHVVAYRAVRLGAMLLRDARAKTRFSPRFVSINAGTSTGGGGVRHRSEERRVGKEGRWRWLPDQQNKTEDGTEE